jgi:Tfp pilus assembly protein PilV
MSKPRRLNGFSLMELMIGIVLTFVILWVAMKMFVGSTISSQQALEGASLQEELRAGMDELARDLNQAGTSLQTVSISIPTSTTGSNPKFGCDPATCYFTANFTQGVLYPITPAYAMGPTTSEATDAIVIAYVDPTLNWSACTTATLASDGSSVTMPATCNGSAISPAVNDPAVGIQVGDIMMLTNSKGAAVGSVTSVSSPTISFANGDPWGLNQTAATGGNIKAIVSGGSPAVSRLMVVTYFIYPFAPASLDGNTDYRLMRQVGTHGVIPVAEHISDLKLSYDLYNNSTGTVSAGQTNPGQANASQIRKISIRLTARWPKPGSKQQVYDYASYSTSIGPRNLSFRDRYD